MEEVTLTPEDVLAFADRASPLRRSNARGCEAHGRLVLFRTQAIRTAHSALDCVRTRRSSITGAGHHFTARAGLHPRREQTAHRLPRRVGGAGLLGGAGLGGFSHWQAPQQFSTLESLEPSAGAEASLVDAGPASTGVP